MLSRLKHLFTQTRFPYILIVIGLTCGIGWEINTINHENRYANHTLSTWRVENVAKVHHDQHEILDYRAQLNALSDEKNMYLNRTMTQSMMQSLVHHGTIKDIKYPNLAKDPRYMHLNTSTMHISDHDNNKVTDLQDDIRADRRAIRYDRNHNWFTNAMHPQKAPIFQKMVYNGAAAGLLIIIDASFLTYVAKFKDIQLKKWKQSREEAKRQHYISEFGDDDGFNNSDSDND